MTTNPYASPADAAAVARPSRNPLLPVAITLLVMSVLWILFCLYCIALFAYMLAKRGDGPEVEPYRMYMGTFLTSLACQAVVISGCVSMIRRSSCIWPFVACWLACIPGLSPCYFFAIPVGIWGLIVLWRPETRAILPPIDAAREPLRGVAISIVTTAVIGLVFTLFGVNYFTTMAMPGQSLTIPLGFLAASFLYQLVLIRGGLKMVDDGSYGAAQTTCALACLPFLGPCYFAAIPFGIWGLMVLRRAEVRAELE
jgi:hypothetical protein